GNLVALPKVMNSQQEIAIFRAVEDKRFIDKMGDALKSDVTVLVNFANVSEEFRHNVVNFLMGIAYAKDGSSQRITDKVYCFAPHGVKLTVTDKEESEPISNEDVNKNLEESTSYNQQHNNVRRLTRRDWS
ncbi:cell division protein SepF, partial [bacterium]|nr:cell division protein SepF [bacterium]